MKATILTILCANKRVILYSATNENKPAPQTLCANRRDILYSVTCENKPSSQYSLCANRRVIPYSVHSENKPSSQHSLCAKKSHTLFYDQWKQTSTTTLTVCKQKRHTVFRNQWKQQQKLTSITTLTVCKHTVFRNQWKQTSTITFTLCKHTSPTAFVTSEQTILKASQPHNIPVKKLTQLFNTPGVETRQSSSISWPVERNYSQSQFYCNQISRITFPCGETPALQHALTYMQTHRSYNVLLPVKANYRQSLPCYL